VGQSNMRMGVTSAAKQSVTPAQTLPDFNVTSSELLADDYDMRPLLALWTQAHRQAFVNALVEAGVVTLKSNTTPEASQLATSTISA